MQAMMQNMMNSMMAAVAPKEQEDVKSAVKKSVKTLTREEFLALEEVADDKAVSLEELDFEVISTKSCKYNRSVPSDIGTANHLAISQKYGAKWSKKVGGYTFNSSAELRNFLNSYQIKTELTDIDRHNIKLYKADRAKARAEYYAKKAEDMNK